MEQFVLGFFQEQLAKVIVGFRKEQVNANLLNGKGEITNVSLNCAVINEAVRKLSPFLEFEEIHVNRLGFHVTAWANLRKAPIVVDIGVVTAVLHEPLQCLPRSQRKKIQILTERELVQLLLQGLYKPLRGNGSYGFGDRIVDNLTIEIEKLHLSYQTWGKFKTRRIGPWTPPTFQIEVGHLKLVAVDQYGHEANPDQVWEHNRMGMPEFMLYKKMSGELHVKLIDATSQSTVHVIQRLQFENHMAIKRRLRDGAILGIQADLTIPSVNIEIEAKDIVTLAHWVAALQYCFSKDRSFDDPLRAETADSVLTSEVTEEKEEFDMEGDEEEEVEGDEGDDDDYDDDDKNDDDSFEEAPADTTAIPSDDENDAKADRIPTPQLSHSASSDAPYKERPLILLPNGLVVYENVCFTCSVHDVTIRGVYGKGRNGFIQLSSKGCISELIWPKADNEPGIYFQTSVSFLSVQERLDRRVNTLMIGGIAHGDHLSIHKPSKKPREVHADENFPLFERRAIRDDPLDLRHTFPSQAFGAKTTVDILPSTDENNQPPMVLHEIGVDEFDFVFETAAWCRALRFALNEDGGGFDPRWHSGDWTELLTTAMLKDPKAELRLEEHLQTAKQILLDENSMISSDRFNVTARFSNIEFRIPAAVRENVRSCDIMFQVKETTIVISSALPRTFLSGKIGNSISGDALNEKGTIDFPNDPSDIAYSLEKAEDPSLRLSGFQLSRNVSTFRVQLSVRAFQVKIIPIIPFCNAPETLQLVAPMAMTTIICFEGEPPLAGSNSIKIALFISTHIHSFKMNVDIDLLAGATSSILYNYDILEESITKVSELMASSHTPINNFSNTKNQGVDAKVKKGLKGRRVLVRRQFTQSRETGGLGVVFCLQVSECGITIWRQNVPYTSPLRHEADCERTESSGRHDHVHLLKLVDTKLKEFEIGIEFDFQSEQSRRTIVKCCLEEGCVLVCDVEKAMGNQSSHCIPTSQLVTPATDAMQTKRWYMAELVTFGTEKLPGALNASYSGENHQLAIRLEEQVKAGARSWSLSADLNCPTTVNACVEEVNDTIILLMEALLLPTWSKHEFKSIEGAPFPSKTIGAMFYSLLSDGEGPRKSLEITWDQRPDTSKIQSSDPMVERALRTIFKLFLPGDLQLLLLRLEIANLLLSIPDDIHEETRRSLGMHLMQTDLVVRFYPTPGTQSSQMEDVLACKGVAWSSLIDTQEEGYYQSIKSRQSLLSISLRGKDVHVEELVHPFHIGLTYAAAKVHLAMDEDMKVNDIRRIESFFEGMKGLQDRSVRHHAQLLSFLAAIKQPIYDSFETFGETSALRDVSSNLPTIRAQTYPSTKTNIARTRLMLNRVHAELGEYEKSIRRSLHQKSVELETLQKKVFEKEKSRFAVLALMSSRIAGWIRTGGVHLTGQRVARKSTMWPSWAVLRKNLLVLYSSPGDPKPSDVILLEGAKIRQLAGGRSKQDVKRGFALIEHDGMTRYFIASSSQEFSRWITEISAVIDSYKMSSIISRDEHNLPLSGFDQESSDHSRALEVDSADVSGHPSENDWASQDGDGDDPGRVKRLGGRLAGAKSRIGAALESARQKGKEISERRRDPTGILETDVRTSAQDEPRLDTPIDDAVASSDVVGTESHSFVTENAPGLIADEMDANDAAINGNRRRLQFGKALTGMKLATKNKLGTAIQNARQKSSMQTPPRPFSGSRGKVMELSSGPQDVFDKSLGNRSAASSFDGSVGTSTYPTSHWTCKACTFINTRQSDSKGDQVCGMCGTAMSSLSVEVAEGDTSVSEPNLGDAVASVDFNGEVLPDESSRRSRFGALGAAVRNVRQNSLDDSSENNQDPRGRGLSSRFNFRKRRPEASTEPILFDDTAVTINRVHASGFAPSVQASDIPIVPLKLLEGNWVVSVKPRKSCVGQALSVSVSSDSLLEMNSDTLSPDDATSRTSNTGPSDTMLANSQSFNKWTMTDLFAIRTQRSDTAVNQAVIETTCSFGALMQLHAIVSESVGEILPQLSYEHFARKEQSILFGSSLDSYDLVEHVLLTGRMLGGFFDQDVSQENLAKTRDYQAEIVEWFLNSLLQCPLPIETLAEIADLLGISASTKDVGQNDSNGVDATNNGRWDDIHFKETSHEEGKDVIERDPNLSLDRPQQIFSLLAACSTELLRAETLDAIDQFCPESEPVPETDVKDVPSEIKTQVYAPLLPPSVSDRMLEAMHEALVNAMAERDEAHAQLIASNVLHVHEIEQERRKNQKLRIEKELKEERSRLQQPNVASFFQNLNDDRSRRNLETKLNNFERILIRNNDTELADTTRQLAEEVNAKTSHALEIVRLKEAREIERKNDAAEKQALKDELRRVKSLLAKYESKVEPPDKQLSGA